jgi:hypothetical protein
MPAASGAEPAIEVRSNRPDLISADDVLIEIVLPPGTPPSSAVLLDDGAPAQGEFGLDPDDRWQWGMRPSHHHTPLHFRESRLY